MEIKRSSGVLLNISSLPGEFGIGGFTADAYQFVEEIASMGFHWWQLLPVTSVGAGNSPYSSVSSYAGNYLYIDICDLDGLLKQEECDEGKYRGSIYLTDYPFALSTKKELLKRAFSRTDAAYRERLVDFAEKNDWLPDYALFMTLCEKYGKEWIKWEKGLRTRDPEALAAAKKENEDSILYYYFEQYHFYRQWKRLKEYANSYGIGIIGDMPIYVCYESVDVWKDPKCFKLNENLEMTVVAGVPPDYFNEEGQLWKNPVYDYEELKKDGYSYLVKRIKHNLSLYDLLRIDHFRGFYKYWEIPASSASAKDGEWCDGPKMELWNALKREVGDPNIIVEDLGIIGADIKEFVKATGFCGMSVMQFGFDGDVDNPHLPHNYPKETVAYTATHDNDTTLGWLLSLDYSARNHALTYVGCQDDSGWASGGGYCRATKAFIKSLLSSSAVLAVVPLQDLCGYGSDTRMNTPGIPEGNWAYRTNYSALNSIDREYLRNLNNLYGRNRNVLQ